RWLAPPDLLSYDLKERDYCIANKYTRSSEKVIDAYLFSTYNKAHEKEKARTTAQSGRGATQRESASSSWRGRERGFQRCRKTGRGSFISLGARAATPSGDQRVALSSAAGSVLKTDGTQLIVLTSLHFDSIVRSQKAAVN